MNFNTKQTILLATGLKFTLPKILLSLQKTLGIGGGSGAMMIWTKEQIYTRSILVNQAQQYIQDLQELKEQSKINFQSLNMKE